MTELKFISTNDAMDLAKTLGVNLSLPTIIKYAESYGLGHQIGGRGGKWVIDKKRFMEVISGKKKPELVKIEDFD